MSKIPVPYNDAKRVQALHSYHILDSLSEETYDRLTQLAALICEVPISLITLVDEDRQWFKSKVGLDIQETPREQSFCLYALIEPNYFEVEDASKDERFLENPLVTGDPNIKFYAGYPLLDEEGYALGTLCVIDRKPGKLTDKQRQALALLADEVMLLIKEKRKRNEFDNFQKLFEISNDLICIAGNDGFLKKVNPAFETLLGWDTKTLLEKPFINLVHPEDLEKTKQEIGRLAAEGRPIYFSNRIRTKNGDYKTLQWAGTPEPVTGNIFSIARDITEEKKKEELVIVSENKFRSFFEYSQGLMCTHDLDGKFLSVNTSGAALLGYTVEEMMQKSLFDIVPQIHHSSLSGYLSDISANGKSKGLMTTLHKNGSIRVWLYNNTVEKNIDGNRYVIGNSIDITERLQLEKDLKRTKEILEETNQLARVGAWDFNTEKQQIFWSGITKQIHEVPDNFIPELATAVSFYKEGESRTKIVQALEAAMVTGSSWDLELQIVTAKGNERWVRVLGKADWQGGKCKRLYGAFQDIDEQKRTKLALEANENKYRAFFEISPVGIAINRHHDGKFIDGNKALYRMIGYSEEEYRQLTHWDVTPARYDEDELKHRKSLTDTGRYGPYEKKYIHKNGHTIPVLLNGIKFIGSNGEEQVYSVVQDISDRKQAEKALIIEKSRLSAFVENAPAAVAMFDTGVKYIAVSNRWMEEYQLVGKNILGLSHYEVFPNISQNWKDIHSRCLNGAVEKNEEDVWTPPGWDHEQYLRWEVRPWYLYDGSIGGIMMFTQDITQICLQREELKTAKKQAEQASLAKSEFLASMSHEIRTPLNGVIGFTDLILKTRLDETQQQYLSIVNQSANTLLGIINDILDFSKIEAGKLELEIEKCDLYEIGSLAADIISYQVKKKKLEMLLNISTDLPRFIWADVIRLKQILINLLSNASKFTEEGEIELKIEPLTDPSQKEITIRFEVRDTGIGIRVDKQKKIFQAFSQEDGTVTRKYGGTGLGLTISNKLLALMGSSLQLESVPGKGSRFFFDLVLTTEKGLPTLWENISAVKQVLIVDDNENNRTILSQMLLLENIRADIAKTGMEALQILETGRKYDVILMDFNMPILDGLETIQKIRDNFYASPAEQPIMLLSSSSDEKDVIKRCEELGVAHRLVKPIKMDDLYGALSKLNRLSNKGEIMEERIQPENNMSRVRVLIAEDGEVNMLLAKTIIRRIAPNAEIMEAADGSVAVKVCKAQMPDIIFMDIQMPEMNGYEATRIIRSMKTEKHIPIIAITAGNLKGEREKCIEAGMDDFIAKPIIENTVRSMFHKWMAMNAPEDAPKLVSNIGNERDHVDFSYIKDIMSGDEMLLRGFLTTITAEIAKSMKELEECFLRKDLGAIKRSGHKLKGTTLTAGLHNLSQSAIALDGLAEFDETHVAGILAAAQKEVGIVAGIIHQYMNK